MACAQILKPTDICVTPTASFQGRQERLPAVQLQLGMNESEIVIGE
jgi:hypothetical protein